MDLQEIARHIAVLNDDFTKLSIAYAILAERVDWLVRFFWILITASVGAFLTNVWQLIKMHKK